MSSSVCNVTLSSVCLGRTTVWKLRCNNVDHGESFATAYINKQRAMASARQHVAFHNVTKVTPSK